jgi:hypothetical protein
LFVNPHNTLPTGDIDTTFKCSGGVEIIKNRFKTHGFSPFERFLNDLGLFSEGFE